MGGLANLAKRAGIGGSTLNVIEELERHPEAALLTGGLSGLRGLQGRGSHGGNVRGRGPVHPPSLPNSFGNVVSPNLAKLVDAMETTGRTVEGLQPWHVSGYVAIASGSVIAASADISDMFATAQTRAFTAADTFPWTFLARRFRCALMTAPVPAGVEDGAWARQLSLRFAVATEVGRISLDAMGVDRIIEAATGTSGGGTASQYTAQAGVNFPCIFEKNGTYQMFLHTDFPITTTLGFAFTYQMDGWVVQNTSAITEQAIVNALGSLVG